MIEMPYIEKSKCDGCGLCIAICSCKALVMVDNVVIVVETMECDYCTMCEAVCPTGAIHCPFEIVIENGKIA